MAIKYILIAVGVALAAGAGWYALSMSETGRTITVGTATIAVEVADTESLREQGLSGRTSLAEGKGMLFVFDTDDTWGIWMKDMQFPLDIVWISAEGVVVSVKAGAAPESYPEAFYPTAPARYVLELPAGYAAAQGIVEGVKVVI